MFDNGELEIMNTIDKEYIEKYEETGEAVFIEGATIWYNVINTKTDRGEVSSSCRTRTSVRPYPMYSTEILSLKQPAATVPSVLPA